MKTTLLRLVIGLALTLGAAQLTAATTSSEPSPSPAKERLKALWVTDHAGAMLRAREEGRPVLVNFTGSDWCVWCHRIEDQILATEHFLEYAEDHLILLYLDFPRRTALPAALTAQNTRLREQFGVQGYPTLILLDPEGRELGRLGYMAGGPKTFVRELKRLLNSPTPAAGSAAQP